MTSVMLEEEEEKNLNYKSMTFTQKKKLIYLKVFGPMTFIIMINGKV